MGAHTGPSRDGDGASRDGGEIMERIEVGRYRNDVGWRGWIGAPEWIIFERPGELWIYAREEETGAVVGEPTVFSF